MCPLSEYLKQIHSILPQHREVSVHPLAEGFSNKVYQIHWAHRPQLVLRIADRNSQAFGIDRKSELEIWQLASQAGLTARLCWCDETVTASEFLSGHTFSWTVTHNTETLAHLCDAVVTLHRLPAVNQQYDIYELIDHWLAQLRQAVLAPAVEGLLGQLERINQKVERVPRPTRLVLCHNDLNPKNILFDPLIAKMWLIDWESAGMNDPLCELAIIAHTQHLDERQLCQAFQRILVKEPSAKDYQNLASYRQAYVLRELTWLLLKHHLGGAQDLDCLQWYHSLINDPVFNPYFKVEAL